MDWFRFGRLVRALRIDRRLTQLQLARRARVSQTLVSKVERGGAATVRPRLLQLLAESLGARMTVRLDWNGEALDRLIDRDHADLVDQVIARLRDAGWETVPEATFLIRGERGSVDVLAWRAPSEALLIVEVKSVVPDIQGMLGPIDRKLRLASEIAASRTWRPRSVGLILVIGDSRTSRRRVERHAATFASRFPDRIARIRRYIANPIADTAALRGLWFLPFSTRASSRHRVSRSTAGRPASRRP